MKKKESSNKPGDDEIQEEKSATAKKQTHKTENKTVDGKKSGSGSVTVSTTPAKGQSKNKDDP